jgi:DNA replication protein DnaC
LESIAECPICGGSGLIWGKTVRDGIEYENVRDCDCRLARKVARMLEKSGFDKDRYEEMSLERFLPTPEEASVMKETAIAFLNDRSATGIGYFGASGTGKTHICIAVCRELAFKKRVPHRYFAYRKDINAIKALMYGKPDAYILAIAELCAVPVLYMDDVFKLSRNRGVPDNGELRIMHTIINDRYINKRITLFSSECSLAEIAEIDEATGSRIYEMCSPYLMKCKGNNRRIKNAGTRKRVESEAAERTK